MIAPSLANLRHFTHFGQRNRSRVHANQQSDFPIGHSVPARAIWPMSEPPHWSTLSCVRNPANKAAGVTSPTSAMHPTSAHPRPHARFVQRTTLIGGGFGLRREIRTIRLSDAFSSGSKPSTYWPISACPRNLAHECDPSWANSIQSAKFGQRRLPNDQSTQSRTEQPTKSHSPAHL